MGLVALVHWGTENSVVRYALLPIFLAFEVMFYGLLEVLSERHQGAVPLLGGGLGQHAGSGQHGPVPLDPASGVPALHPGHAPRGRPAPLSRVALESSPGTV